MCRAQAEETKSSDGLVIRTGRQLPMRFESVISFNSSPFSRIIILMLQDASRANVSGGQLTYWAPSVTGRILITFEWKRDNGGTRSQFVFPSCLCLRQDSMEHVYRKKQLTFTSMAKSGSTVLRLTTRSTPKAAYSHPDEPPANRSGGLFFSTTYSYKYKIYASEGGEELSEPTLSSIALTYRTSTP